MSQKCFLIYGEDVDGNFWPIKVYANQNLAKKERNRLMVERHTYDYTFHIKTVHYED